MLNSPQGKRAFTNICMCIHAQFMRNLCAIYAQFMRNLRTIYARFMHNLCTRLAQFTHEFCTPSAHFSTLQHTGVREPVPCGTPGGQPRGRRRPFFPCSPSLSRNKNRPLHFGILTSDPQLRPMSGTARVATIMHAGPRAD